MQAPLDENKLKFIKQQCADGYVLYDKNDFKAALRLFYQAWLRLPKPQTDFEASGWVLTAIGDTYFRLGQYTQALEALDSALHCLGSEHNPFIMLRTGQCHFENQALGPARQALFKAWNKGGAVLFESEDEKYYRAIEDLARTAKP